MSRKPILKSLMMLALLFCTLMFASSSFAHDGNHRYCHEGENGQGKKKGHYKNHKNCGYCERHRSCDRDREVRRDGRRYDPRYDRRDDRGNYPRDVKNYPTDRKDSRRLPGVFGNPI